MVKPPHIPVLRKRIMRGLSPAFFAAAAVMIPIINAPSTFIISVFTGKTPERSSGMSDMAYRAAAPINPPAPTARKFNIFVSFLRAVFNCIPCAHIMRRDFFIYSMESSLPRRRSSGSARSLAISCSTTKQPLSDVI